MTYSLLEKAEIDERVRKDAAKRIEELENKVADISDVEQLKKTIS